MSIGSTGSESVKLRKVIEQNIKQLSQQATTLEEVRELSASTDATSREIWAFELARFVVAADLSNSEMLASKSTRSVPRIFSGHDAANYNKKALLGALRRTERQAPGNKSFEAQIDHLYETFGSSKGIYDLTMLQKDIAALGSTRNKQLDSDSTASLRKLGDSNMMLALLERRLTDEASALESQTKWMTGWQARSESVWYAHLTDAHLTQRATSAAHRISGDLVVQGLGYLPLWTAAVGIPMTQQKTHADASKLFAHSPFDARAINVNKLESRSLGLKFGNGVELAEFVFASACAMRVLRNSRTASDWHELRRSMLDSLARRDLSRALDTVEHAIGEFREAFPAEFLPRVGIKGQALENYDSQSATIIQLPLKKDLADKQDEVEFTAEEIREIVSEANLKFQRRSSQGSREATVLAEVQKSYGAHLVAIFCNSRIKPMRVFWVSRGASIIHEFQVAELKNKRIVLRRDEFEREGLSNNIHRLGANVERRYKALESEEFAREIFVAQKEGRVHTLARNVAPETLGRLFSVNVSSSQRVIRAASALLEMQAPKSSMSRSTGIQRTLSLINPATFPNK